MQSFDINRIKRMSELYGSILQDIEQQFDSDISHKQITRFVDQLRMKVLMLDSYYTSGDWHCDFKADEAGLLPKDINRSVLSEDGIHNLLDAFKEFEQKWENPEPIDEVYGPPSWFK